ncbi:MAG: carboxypeptidase regulatory-like domain-containing protein [Terriglobales bacterium]
MKNKFILSTALLLAICPLLHAAGSSIRGTVTAGPNATPIANARVTLRGGGHEQAASTDPEGNYELLSLDPSLSYSLVVEADGLRSFSKGDIALKDGEAQRINVRLELADVHTEVLVTDGVVNLEAASAEISQTIDPTEVQDLPSVTRSAAKYALLDPHVRQVLGLGANYQDSNRLSIDASSYRNTSYMLDGTTNYDWVYAVGPQATVSAASVDEVKVLTGNYSAQYGTSTTGIIDITTPSGTNAHHGDFFSYIRPSGIQADPEAGFGHTTIHVPNQKLDWGASVGGPVIKDRTYYFGSYERVEADRGAILTVPTESFFDGTTNEYSGLFRLDHNLTNKNTLTARFNGWHYATNNADDRIAGGNLPSYGRTARVQSWGGQVTDQAVIGNMVNVARFAYTNYVPDSATPLDPSVGVSIDHYDPADNVTTGVQEGYSTWSWVHAQTETAGDLLAFRHGRHDLKFGGEFIHLHVKDYSNSPDGTYYFHTDTDFTNNNPYKYAQTFGVADVRYGQKELSAFVEDDVRLSPRLTANLGLRYEFQSITDSHHNFGPRVGLAWDATGDGKTMIRAGGGIFFDQYYMYLNRRFITLGPDSPQASYTWNCTAIPNPCPTYPTPSAPASGYLTTGSVNLYVPAAKLLNPYSFQFSASVERQIARNTVLTLSGLQVHTLQQMRVNDINHPAPCNPSCDLPGATPRTAAAANLTRPYLDPSSPYGYSSYDGLNNVLLVDRIENTASSVYQSFDLSLKQRFARWGEISAHYVYAASYTYAMFYADYNSGIPSEWYPNWNNLERGPDDFYQRNRFITDAVLRGPYQTTFSLVGTFGTGLPVNPLTGKDSNGDGYSTDRPYGFARNSFRTPALKTVDLALAKRFTLRERLSAETRVEALNSLNSKNFISVNNDYGAGTTPSSSFLTPEAGITNTDPSRQLQFVVRLLF